MNNRQKQKRLLLAIAFAALLRVILAISLIIGCATRSEDSASSAVQQSNADVIVSEILMSNKQTVRDPLGTYSDYVELYNKSDRDIDLFGYWLTDDEISLWMFPAE